MAMPKQVLVVVTSTIEYPDGSPTGFWLSEVTHPYFHFIESGWQVAFASISGAALADEGSVEDAKNNKDVKTMEFWEDEEKKALLESAFQLGGEGTPPVEELVTQYDVVYFAGGYGSMWDFPTCEPAAALVKAMHAAGKVVAAVCHGPIIFGGITLDDETKVPPTPSASCSPRLCHAHSLIRLHPRLCLRLRAVARWQGVHGLHQSRGDQDGQV